MMKGTASVARAAQGLILLGLAMTGFAGAPAACAPVDEVPPLGAATYVEDFSRPAEPKSFATAYPGLATWGYFGDEPSRLRFEAVSKRALTQKERFTSRAWPGTLNAYIDDDYCPGAWTPSAGGQGLQITAARFASDPQRSACGQGREWGSSIVTSQPSFSQTFGYFEADAKPPCDLGRWSAFWLLPKERTASNGGRLAEVDVFEHYGGATTLLSQGRPVVIDRVARPFSTLHSGMTGAEVVASNVSSLPPVTAQERSVFCGKFHKFGVLWTPQEFRFYVDRRETFRTPNPGVNDAHYWVLNLDIAKSAGDPDEAPQASTFFVRSVKAWALRPPG